MQPLPHDLRAAADFVARYLRKDGDAPLVPTLGDSLAVMARMERMGAALDGLGPVCRCLIQGCTAPRNAESLRRFLGHPDVRTVSVTAVDLLDLPAICHRLGRDGPAAAFVQADARDLRALFPAGRFDVLAQDFLLNCAPPAEAAALLAAAHAVLRPGGLLLFSITDSAGLSDHPAIEPNAFAQLAGTSWDGTARDLAVLVPDAVRRGRVLQRLGGRLVADPREGSLTLVIAPHGRFEFFVPLSRTERQLAEAGFTVLEKAAERGRDDNGLDCRRWRILARRN